MSQPDQTQDQPASSTKNSNHLIWVDMEMTGLNPATDRIIEVAIVVTDSELEVVAQSPELAIHQSDAVLDGMDEWNTRTHGRSGLIERVRASTLSEEAAQTQLLDWLAQYIDAKKSPMCGNSICQDRRFMANYMPKLEEYFHYRNLDVSTLKELARRWRPGLSKGFTKKTQHTALADITESIEEMRYYREHFIVSNPPE